MTRSSSKNDPSERFALLGDNSLSIAEGTDAEKHLFERIVGYFEKSYSLEVELRDTRFSLYVVAASLRRKYLDPKTNKYDPEFRNWFFRRRALTDRNRFGKLSNFVKFAKIGTLVHFIATNSEDAESDLAKLPLNPAALYQIHIVRERLFLRAKDQRTFWQLFEATPKRKSLTDARPKLSRDPLIHPEARAEDIRKWRKAWEDPSSTEIDDSRTREFTVPIATIYAHKTLYEFDQRTGDHKGIVKLTDLQEFLKQVASVAAKSRRQLYLDSKLPDIQDKFSKLTNSPKKPE